MILRVFPEHKNSPNLNRTVLAYVTRRILRKEGRVSETLNVALVDDGYLLGINQRFLNHNYKTDVISFDLGQEGKIEGEVYVSVDRARIQSRKYGISLEKEVLRLIFHGILHLAGWDDTTRSQKLRMRKRENEFIHAYYEKKNRG